LYLTDARYIDARTLEIHEGRIIEVDEGPGGSIRFVDRVPPGATSLDCAGRLVTHAFAIGHHHIYSCLARGMPPPKQPPTTFVQILERIWWRLDRRLDTEMIRASALAAGVAAATCGATFIIDHHASPNAAEGCLHTIADALDRVGLSHLLCCELSDRDGPGPRDAGLAETARYLESRQGLVGLHASFTVGDDLLDRAMDLARRFDTGVHVHVAEAESDQAHCMERHGVRCVQRFARAVALDLPRTILAHCIHVDEPERALIAGSRAWVAQQSESNQNNAVGHLDPRGFADKVFLGTDGMHGDALAAARATYLAGSAVEGLSPVGAYRRLRRVHDYIESNAFEGDGPNNLVVLDYPSPTPITSENWPAHVVYGLTSRHVDSVISDGRVIVEHGRCTLVDEDEVYARAGEQARRLWSLL